MAGSNHRRKAGQVADQGNTDGWGRGRDNVGVDVAAGELVGPTKKINLREGASWGILLRRRKNASRKILMSACLVFFFFLIIPRRARNQTPLLSVHSLVDKVSPEDQNEESRSHFGHPGKELEKAVAHECAVLALPTTLELDSPFEHRWPKVDAQQEEISKDLMQISFSFPMQSEPSFQGQADPVMF